MVRCDVEHLGGHIHVAVWIGPDREHLALAGRLCCRSEEWDELRRALGLVAVNGESYGAPL